MSRRWFFSVVTLAALGFVLGVGSPAGSGGWAVGPTAPRSAERIRRQLLISW